MTSNSPVEIGNTAAYTYKAKYQKTNTVANNGFKGSRKNRTISPLQGFSSKPHKTTI